MECRAEGATNLMDSLPIHQFLPSAVTLVGESPPKMCPTINMEQSSVIETVGEIRLLSLSRFIDCRNHFNEGKRALPGRRIESGFNGQVTTFSDSLNVNQTATGPDDNRSDRNPSLIVHKTGKIIE